MSRIELVVIVTWFRELDKMAVIKIKKNIPL